MLLWSYICHFQSAIFFSLGSSVKEVNGSIIHVSDSLQKQDLKGSGSAQPVGINNEF